MKVSFSVNPIKTHISSKEAMKSSGEFAHLQVLKNGKKLFYKAIQVHIHSPSEHAIDG